MPTSTMPFTKVRTANATDSSFPSKVATTTIPSGTGVIVLGSPSATSLVGYDQLILVPFGTGADNSTFDMRVIGWRLVTTLYLPIVLYQFACTLSGAVGPSATGDLTSSERLADTITTTLGTNSTDVVPTSPAGASLNDVAGQILCDSKGYPIIEITFDLGTATAANCFYAKT